MGKFDSASSTMLFMVCVVHGHLCNSNLLFFISFLVNLPPPCTPKDVGARILAQQRAEATKAVEAMEMEMEDSDEEEEAPAAPKVCLQNRILSR